jgi:hypothetical protein
MIGAQRISTPIAGLAPRVVLAELARRLVCLLFVLAVTGCGAIAQSAVPSRPLGLDEQWLPAVESDAACGGVGFVGEFRLHGSAADPHLAWMTRPDGSRTELVWLPGTRARFTPAFEVHGPNGQRIAGEGSPITGGCPIGSSGAYFVEFQTPHPDLTDTPRVRTGQVTLTNAERRIPVVTCRDEPG